MYNIRMSPTVFESKRLKFKIHFKDHNPPHVHVEGPDAEAVFDLDVCRCVQNNGFSEKAIRQIEKRIDEMKQIFLEAWDEYQK
jgi:hypothetical protein